MLYIPPESSKYSNIDLFDQLEEELLEFSAPYNHDNLPIFICGDLNAWCGEINDFVDYNDASIMNLNSEIGNNLSNIVSLESLGIQINRKSLHKKKPITMATGLYNCVKTIICILLTVGLKMMLLVILLVIMLVS